MDLSLDQGALARLAAPYSGADGESAGGNPAAFHLPLMDPGVSSTPDGGSNMSTDGGGAGGNTAPVFNQANFSFVSTPPAILAEMMRQASQNQQLEGQRAELMLAAQRLRNEADEAFSENEEMRVQAKLFITAAETGYQSLQEQAQNQFMEMSMNHRQHIAGIEMRQSQKVSSLEINLAQQQQTAMDLQRRLTETESVQAQLLKELRDDAPGIPEGAAEPCESIPIHEAPPAGLSQRDDVRSLRTAELFGTPSLKSQPGSVFSPNATVFQPVSPWNDGYGSLAAHALSGNFGRGGPGNGGGGPPGGGGDNPDGGRSSGDPIDPGRPGIPLLKIPKSGGGPPGPPGDDSDPDGGDDFDDDDDELTDKALMRKLKQVLGGKSNTMKEADHIKIPSFPQPENYRNWKIRVRDAVRAASSKPDKAFSWINKVWVEGQTIEGLASPDGFTTLDAKLLAALSSVATGEFARKVDTFKEKEPQKDRPVRGRQVLLMMHEYFSTNIKHGATYSLSDLFNVKMKGDKLKTFLSNWDSVTTGVTHLPETTVLETLFYQQVKNHRAIAHDIEEYHRAEEGSSKHCYQFLYDAVRRHLMRERLEDNRGRIAASVGGAKTSAPAADARTPFIPRGFCVQWNKGGCSKENCPYKHEVPKKREKSATKSPRGRSQSRGKEKRDTSKIARKFWKAGRCKRGDKCEFSHEGQQRPRKATPARSPSRDSQKSDKSKKDKRRKKKGDRSQSRGSSGSRKSGGSRSSKGSRGSRGSAGKSTPAAVCLVASMLASVVDGFSLSGPTSVLDQIGININESQAAWEGEPHIACPGVSFNLKPDITRVHAWGRLDPFVSEPSKPKKTFPASYQTKPNVQAVDDSILSARMLQGAVSGWLKGVKAACRYMCDSDLGCDSCIPSDIVALPASSPREVKYFHHSHEDWIADTGSAQDLLTRHDIPDEFQYRSDRPIAIITANGHSSSNLQAKVYNDTLSCRFDPYLLESTPPVMSVGMRCVDQGYDFIWRSGKSPYFRKPDGEKIELLVRDYVPYIPARAKSNANPCTPNPIDRPRSASSSSLAPTSLHPIAPGRGTAVPAEPASASGDDGMNVLKESPEKDEAGRKATPEKEKEAPKGSADRKVSPMDDVDDDVPQVPAEGNLDRNLGKGISLLKEEAKSLGHLVSHHPKNPYCDVCNSKDD